MRTRGSIGTKTHGAIYEAAVDLIAIHGNEAVTLRGRGVRHSGHQGMRHGDN